MRSYIINIAHRKERWLHAMEELATLYPLINTPTRIEAIIDEVGWMGCTKSHISALEQAQEECNSEPFAIFEDDVKIIPQHSIKLLTNILDSIYNLNLKWDMLFLGANPTSNMLPVPGHPQLLRLTSAWCAHAIIYNGESQVIKFILDSWHSGQIQKIDVFYSDIVMKQFDCYITRQLLATQIDSYSDITFRKNMYHDLIINNFKKYSPLNERMN